MGNRKDYSEWQGDFAEFSVTEPTAVPPATTRSIMEKVYSDLHPSALRVFTKTAIIHSLVGAVTLLACPQFGISPFGGHGLMHYLMQFGDSICMLGCGAFFTAFSLLIASLVLRPEEVRSFKGNEMLQLAFLATYSLGIFLFLGGQLVLSMALVWGLGAILGGALSFEAGWAYRKFSIRRRLA
jgi:hypothetical protein